MVKEVPPTVIVPEGASNVPPDNEKVPLKSSVPSFALIAPPD